MDYDFGQFIALNLAALDQKLRLFKEFYLSLDEGKRSKFRKWIEQIARPLPDEFQPYCQMLTDMGCTADRVVGVSISIDYLDAGEGARVEPQFLKKAIQAWEQGEDFAPSMDWYSQ
jgi:hypothetical protein